MALGESFLGAILAALGTAMFGIFGWAWNLSSRMAVLEAMQGEAVKTSARMELKLDGLILHLLEKKDRRD
jgi:hypothetical protein